MSAYLNGNKYNIESCDEVRFNGHIYWYKTYPLHICVQFEENALQDSDGFELYDSNNDKLCSSEFESGNFYESIICNLVLTDKKGEFTRNVATTSSGVTFDIPFRKEYIIQIYQNNTLIGTCHLDTPSRNTTNYKILILNPN